MFLLFSRWYYLIILKSNSIETYTISSTKGIKHSFSCWNTTLLIRRVFSMIRTAHSISFRHPITIRYCTISTFSISRGISTIDNSQHNKTQIIMQNQNDNHNDCIFIQIHTDSLEMRSSLNTSNSPRRRHSLQIQPN